LLGPREYFCTKTEEEESWENSPTPRGLPEYGGAIFYSPNKIKETRAIQLERDEAAKLAKVQKEENKLRSEQRKQEKEQLAKEKQQIREANRLARLQAQEEKQRLKEDEIAAS
jgi:hypothetical protein